MLKILRVSKKLARIILDVPIEYNLDDFELSKPDEVGVFKIFDELEFRRIKETFFKIFGVKRSEDNDPSQEYIQGDLFTQSLVNENKLNLTNTKTLYQRIESSNELKYFTKKLLEQKIVAFDTETEGLNSLETEIVGISFCWKSNNGFSLLFMVCSWFVIVFVTVFSKNWISKNWNSIGLH